MDISFKKVRVGDCFMFEGVRYERLVDLVKFEDCPPILRINAVKNTETGLTESFPGWETVQTIDKEP